MPRLRELLAVSLACGVWLMASSTSLLAQPAGLGKSLPQVLPELEPSPLLLEPQTPDDLFSAVLLLVDLGRPELARKYLEQLDAGAPNDDLLIRLRTKHGTGSFLKLTRIKELAPLASQLLEKMNAASRKQSEDPQFVESLVNRLSGNPTQRELATIDLKNAGAQTVPQILKMMRRPDMVDKQDTITIALTRMGRQVVAPLIGGLEIPEERVRAAIFGILATLEAREAIPYLWYPAFAESEPMGVRLAANEALTRLVLGKLDKANRLSTIAASNELRRLAKMLFENSTLLPRDEDGGVTIWGWDDDAQTIAAHKFTPNVAAMLLSARFANQALALSPEQSEAQRQYLGALLGLEVMLNGWDKPREALPGSALYLAVTAGEETVSNVLADALAADQPTVAVPALEALSQIGTREQLAGSRGLKSPVLAALNAPDARVQFAAATAILRIEPRVSFPGANRVVAILSRALSDPGRPRASIIDADATRAGQIAANVNDLGFETIVSSTGRDGFEKTATNAGIEIVLIHVNCMRWDLTQTLANFRADARTAAIPIAIYGGDDSRAAVARLVNRSKPATFVLDNGLEADFRRQVLPFLRESKSIPMSGQERSQQKGAAAYWLATIATSRSAQIFDISQAEKDLLLVAESADNGMNALVALGNISSGGAQRRLVQVALNPQADASLRQTAAAQLNYHIQRFGLLLSKTEIEELHTGWETADQPAVKTALATVVGTLRPNISLVGERLRQFPSPSGRNP